MVVKYSEPADVAESGSPLFDDFLEFLGTRVRLIGFDGYKGGLDIKSECLTDNCDILHAPFSHCSMLTGRQ